MYIEYALYTRLGECVCSRQPIQWHSNFYSYCEYCVTAECIY
jgi:hypothetical protein